VESRIARSAFVESDDMIGAPKGDHDGMTHGSRLSAALAMLLATALAAGCGSTAQVNLEGAAAPGQGGGITGTEDYGLAADGMGAPPSGGGGAAPAGSTGAGGTVAGSAPQAGTAGAGAPGTTGGASSGAQSGGGQTGGTGSSAGTGQMGPGVTADEIVVGIAINDDRDAANSNLLGTEGMTQGDTERYYNIMREEINETGGIAGREMRYSVFRFSTTNTNSSQLEQAGCAHWTQDDRAFTATLSTSENFLSCAQNNQLATTFSGLTTSDDRIFAKYPRHMEHSAMSLTRQMANLADGLAGEKYFDKGYKLGVITFDHPSFARAINGSLAPGLARHGHEIDEIQWVSYLENTNDLGRLTAEVQSAILRFKSEGITHVLIVDEKGVLTLLTTTAAENQNYRPRYGLTSQNGPTVIAAQIPRGQFNRAAGIGWFPQLDVPADELPPNRARDRCLAIFKRHGAEPANANNAGVMVGICERINFVKASVEAGLPDITVDSFARGAESLGGTFPSMLGLGHNLFGPGRHAGAAYYRRLAYDAECNCFHYTSKPIRDR
jgi:hypothetical protein